MEIIPKQNICVFIYLTVIDKFLISIFVIIFAKTVRNWIWQEMIWTQRYCLASLDILTRVKSKLAIEKQVNLKF